MKKAVNYACVFFILISCITFFMSCGGDIGLGKNPENIPENIFNGGEWHNQYHSTKISFTENEFTCIYGLVNPETYTGTYILSQEEGWTYITLSSTETRVNGKIMYSSTDEIIDGVYTDLPYPDVINFFPTENKENIIIGGLFYKQ